MELTKGLDPNEYHYFLARVLGEDGEVIELKHFITITPKEVKQLEYEQANFHKEIIEEQELPYKERVQFLTNSIQTRLIDKINELGIISANGFIHVPHPTQISIEEAIQLVEADGNTKH